MSRLNKSREHAVRKFCRQGLPFVFTANWCFTFGFMVEAIARAICRGSVQRIGPVLFLFASVPTSVVALGFSFQDALEFLTWRDMVGPVRHEQLRKAWLASEEPTIDAGDVLDGK